MKPENMNRQPLVGSPIFEMRGTDVKWPTIRKARLTRTSIVDLRDMANKKGRSIIFLHGLYRTNLNQWVKGHSPIEDAVFFEYMVKHPRVKGAIFALCWIGNFHNGCIFHCAWQYPQVRCWLNAGGDSAEDFLEKQAFKIYGKVVGILYAHSEYAIDAEVAAFLAHGAKQ